MHPLFKTVLPYMERVKLAVVASSSNSQPWVATVFYAFDEDLNLYFLSSLHRRHSQEIMKNPNIGVAIADKTFELGDKVMGLQMEGTCIPLEGDSAKAAFQTFKGRFPKAGEMLKEEMLSSPVGSFPAGEAVHRIWKIKARKIKIFDESVYGSDGKELDLGGL